MKIERIRNSFRLNIDIITKVKLKSTNCIAVPDRESNKLRVDTIRFGIVYFCDITRNEILETLFSREELHYDELVFGKIS